MQPTPDDVSSFTIPADALTGMTVAQPVAPSIVIPSNDNTAPLVTIHPDGRLEYGPNYQPDEAATQFWDAVRHRVSVGCPNCGHTS